jgi:hypothetical protein
MSWGMGASFITYMLFGETTSNVTRRRKSRKEYVLAVAGFIIDHPVSILSEGLRRDMYPLCRCWEC